jgi:hypothetical protein
MGPESGPRISGVISGGTGNETGKTVSPLAQDYFELFFKNLPKCI